MPKLKAFFSCEASPKIGAGHAMRSGVLADMLAEEGWACSFVTAQDTYDFIPALSRFERRDPDTFYKNPQNCDLLVIDNYELDATYEKHFRAYAKKILVIDDLANRHHDCDILLDQTYGRKEDDYRALVPHDCQILTGSEYALIRRDFAKLRHQAVNKRTKTKKIEKILINMGGSDPQNYVLKALQLLHKSEFKGHIDIVLGFSAPHLESVKNFLASMANTANIIVAPDIEKLMYDADLAVGAAGSSMWERSCLGLPTVLIKTAENQNLVYDVLLKEDLSFNFSDLPFILNHPQDLLMLINSGKLFSIVDSMGIYRLLTHLNEYRDKRLEKITHRRASQRDVELLFEWKQDPHILLFSFNKTNPTFAQHQEWLSNKLSSPMDIMEIIICNGEPCGVMRLDYNDETKDFLLSWYVIPKYGNRGIGTIGLEFAKKVVGDKPINAFVFHDNILSKKALEKGGFKVKAIDTQGIYYTYHLQDIVN